MASGLYREYTYQCRNCPCHTDSTSRYVDHMNQHSAQTIERVRSIIEQKQARSAAANDANPQ